MYKKAGCDVGPRARIRSLFCTPTCLKPCSSSSRYCSSRRWASFFRSTPSHPRAQHCGSGCNTWRLPRRRRLPTRVACGGGRWCYHAAAKRKALQRRRVTASSTDSSSSSSSAAQPLASSPPPTESPPPPAAAITAECPGRRPYHVLLTAASGIYQQWQSRIMYWQYKKLKAEFPCSDLGGFTRLLNTRTQGLTASCTRYLQSWSASLEAADATSATTASS